MGQPPDISNSTVLEREKYIKDNFYCRGNCEICGIPDTEIRYSLKDERGSQIMQERVLRPADTEPGVPAELVFPMPPYPFRGIMTLTCGEAAASCAVSCVECAQH